MIKHFIHCLVLNYLFIQHKSYNIFSTLYILISQIQNHCVYLFMYFKFFKSIIQPYYFILISKLLRLNSSDILSILSLNLLYHLSLFLLLLLLTLLLFPLQNIIMIIQSSNIILYQLNLSIFIFNLLLQSSYLYLI